MSAADHSRSWHVPPLRKPVEHPDSRAPSLITFDAESHLRTVIDCGVCQWSGFIEMVEADRVRVFVALDARGQPTPHIIGCHSERDGIQGDVCLDVHIW